MPSQNSLNVSLTPELMVWIKQQVGSGRYRSASEVIRAGLRHLQDERRPVVKREMAVTQSGNA